jgi:hypothetical protein
VSISVHLWRPRFEKKIFNHGCRGWARINTKTAELIFLIRVIREIRGWSSCWLVNSGHAQVAEREMDAGTFPDRAESILNAYGVRCCISDITAPRLLVASHIKPWADFPDNRLDPRNGLCLSSLHDAAFDSGLITLDEAYRVVLSKRLKSYFPQPVLEQNFVPFEGRAIRLPDKLAEPHLEFLAYHRDAVFNQCKYPFSDVDCGSGRHSTPPADTIVLLGLPDNMMAVCSGIG